MVYTKPSKYGKYRKYRKRGGKSTVNRYFGYASKAVDIAGKALATSYAIKKLINVEFKNYDSSNSSTLTATQQTLLFNPTQGDTASTREGRSVLLKSLYLRGELVANASATASNRVRIIVICDTQTNNSQFSLSNDFFTGTVGIDVFRDLANTKRFKVLYDRVYCVVPSTDRQIYRINLARSLQQHIKFDGNAGTVADLPQHSYWIVAFAQNTGASSAPVFSWQSRARFIDN